MTSPAPTVTECYRNRIVTAQLDPDIYQAAAVEKLEIFNNRLKNYRPNRDRPHFARGFFGFGRKAAKPQPMLQGLYLFGGVGRGKSMLMDLFHETTSISPRYRVHFHHFMRDVHARLRPIRDRGHDGDAIMPLAHAMIAETTLLCFDEFDVTDIADAMIIGRLFTALFDLGILVVATSNRSPDTLYAGGLNRAHFLPFIGLLKDRLDIVHMGGKNDYRISSDNANSTYLYPLNASTRAQFDTIAKHLGLTGNNPLRLDLGKNRSLTLIDHHEGIGRSSFADLCAQPRAAADYITLAQTLHILLLSDIPALTPARRNEAIRLITLIDILYDHQVKLIVSAELPASKLYPRGHGADRFIRTVSRLAEMSQHNDPANIGLSPPQTQNK